jgi:hypothetical protein
LMEWAYFFKKLSNSKENMTQKCSSRFNRLTESHR